MITITNIFEVVLFRVSAFRSPIARQSEFAVS